MPWRVLLNAVHSDSLFFAQLKCIVDSLSDLEKYSHAFLQYFVEALWAAIPALTLRLLSHFSPLCSIWNFFPDPVFLC